MIANTISYLISRSLQETPFFTMIARDEGLDLPSLDRLDLPVSGALARADGTPCMVTLRDGALRFLKDHAVLPVCTRSRPYRLVGTVRLDDVLRTYGASGR